MRRWLPDRRGWTDVALLLTLSALALAGLAPTFAGARFWVVGLVGLVVGVVLVRVSGVLGWPFIAPVVLALASYALLGPPVALGRPPTPGAVLLLVDHLALGWKDLLTTLPPVDPDSTLLALPLVLGLTTAVLGALLARIRVTAGRSGVVAAAAPVVAPTLLLAAVILLGVRQPHSVLLQGVLFAALALVWLVLRTERRTVSDHAVLGGRVRRGRVVAGTLLIAVAAGLALPVSTWVSEPDPARLVLRDHVEPPFDVGRYPSPLSSFRRYVEQPKQPDAENLHSETLMTVEGAEPGTRLRFAALDEYDGVVWGASNDSSSGGQVDGTFQRVSSRIANPATGPAAEVAITLGEGYSGVWLPTVGALTRLEFTDGQVVAQEESFRYNLATSTGIVPTGLQPGDRYTFEAVLTDTVLDAGTAPASYVGHARTASGFLSAQAQDWSQSTTRPMEQVLAVADRLRSEGKYSDGVRASESFYRAGHHQARLSDADGGLNSPIIVGNDEQYAAWMGLLVNQLGVPARVVLGAVVPEGGVVTGADVAAWVEVQAADDSWHTVPTETFMDFDRPAELPPREQEEMTGTNVPPPAPIPPPSTVGDPTDAELNALRNKRDPDDSFRLPAWLRTVLLTVGLPLLLCAGAAGAVVGAKAWRRRRRRSAAEVSRRFGGGWREVVDHARDLGASVSGATRREESLTFADVPGADVVVMLARRADMHVFGPQQPDADTATAYWADVDAARAAMSGRVSRGRRLRAALSVRTFGRRR